MVVHNYLTAATIVVHNVRVLNNGCGWQNPVILGVFGTSPQSTGPTTTTTLIYQ